MKHNFEVREINKYVALDMVQKYHYSNTLPKLNKYFLGFYENEDLKGVITLGWGTRPKHTIKKTVSGFRCTRLFRNRQNVYDRGNGAQLRKSNDKGVR